MHQRKEFCPMNLNHAISPIVLLNWINAASPSQSPSAASEDAMSTVWRGEWNTSADGVYETRVSVVRSVEGFLPTLEVSQRGGDCTPRHADAVRPLARAAVQALANERAWHTAHDLADLDAAGLVY
jgi:hypothetical protein